MKARRGGLAALWLVVMTTIHNVVRDVWKILLDLFRCHNGAAVGVVHVQHNAFRAAPTAFAAYVVSKSTGHMVKRDGFQQIGTGLYYMVVGVSGVLYVAPRLGAGQRKSWHLLRCVHTCLPSNTAAVSARKYL